DLEHTLQEAVKEDKGSGCEFPQLDPFAKEATQFDKVAPKIRCEGQDWVRCYVNILFENDFAYTIGPPTVVLNEGVYTLTKSDHATVSCMGNYKHKTAPPPGRENSLDVLILGFDSASKNGFIRKMPKSYKFLTEELGATVMNGYNIVGDGTPAALFPILTGKTELELPDFRKISKYKGFKKQPADHYLRALYLEARKLRICGDNLYCMGDTLNYKMMMNITEQLFKLDGKLFAFTFISDITHNNFNLIAVADGDTRSFLEALRASGRMDNTLLIVMGDHGPRYADVRNTLQGKFEERMPLMAIRLPEALKRSRPDVAAILRNNSQVLTTPHDLHETLLDAMGLERYANHYKIRGADLTRGISLFKPIPSTRSCSEAGIEPHWCACVAWDSVSPSESIYKKAAEAFLEYINSLTQYVRSKCVPRTLTSIEWVMRRHANRKMLAFSESKDIDGFIANFNSNFKGYNAEPSCISATHPHLNMYCYCRDQ
ncbi:Uncharacterized protein OBRU01_12570, partial [Operophtera brumata]